MNLTNILLLEDDYLDVIDIRRSLDKMKVLYKLHVAKNGEEAIDILSGKGEMALNTLPDIALIDINMPKMNGIEFLRELRADPELRLIPVIVLTTSNEDKDKVEAYNLNVAGYILKPVTFSSFVEAVATLNKYWTLSELP